MFWNILKMSVTSKSFLPTIELNLNNGGVGNGVRLPEFCQWFIINWTFGIGHERKQESFPLWALLFKSQYIKMFLFFPCFQTVSFSFQLPGLTAVPQSTNEQLKCNWLPTFWCGGGVPPCSHIKALMFLPSVPADSPSDLGSW